MVTSARYTQEPDATVLLQVLSSMEEALVAYDAGGKLLVCNQAFRDMYGYSVEQSRPGVHFQELGEIDIRNGNVVLEDDRGEDYLQRKKAYRKALEGSFTVKLRDGRWIRTTDRSMPGGGFVSVQVDITEVKEYEGKLRTARAEAEEANRAKSEFFANMSHELRTPLNAIIGFSSLLQGDEFGSLGEDKSREYVEFINGSGKHLHRLIGDILDLPKIETGEQSLSEEHINIREIIRECLEMTSDRSSDKHLSFPVEIQPNIPALEADRLKVIQILLNLLSNAIRFTPHGGRVGIEAMVTDQNAIELTVADTGKGMSSDDMKTVMGPFCQTGSALIRHHDGPGLGLPLVKSLTDLHGGTVRLISHVGKGTSVTIQFPPERTCAA